MRKKEPTPSYARTYMKWIVLGESALFLGALYYYFRLNSSREYRLKMLQKGRRRLEGKYLKNSKYETDMSGQTVQSQIRLLLQEQSDQGSHCLPFHLHLLEHIIGLKTKEATTQEKRIMKPGDLKTLKLDLLDDVMTC